MHTNKCKGIFQKLGRAMASPYLSLVCMMLLGSSFLLIRVDWNPANWSYREYNVEANAVELWNQLTCSFDSDGVTEDGLEVNNIAFNHYALAIQWPLSRCSRPGIYCDNTRMPRDFTIHGLWPSYANGTPLSKNICPPEEFPRLKTIARWPFINELACYWPNIELSGSDYTFWEHEWLEHGVCSGLLPKQFFKKACDFYYNRRIDTLVTDLGTKGVHPGQSYLKNDIHQALIDIMGHIVTIKCLRKDHKFYIWEIYVCADPSPKSLEQVNCPSQFIRCGSGRSTLLHLPNQLFCVPRFLCNVV